MKSIAVALICAISLTLAASHARAAGDAANGEKFYEECKGCHDMRENKAGPRHCWLVGRKAAKVPGYSYSEVMKDSDLVWDEKTLDKFLASPITFLNGTNMGYVGLSEAKERADLIAYLLKATSDPKTCDGIDKLH